MKLLDHQQVQQKIDRLAIEILERNYKEKKIILAGINKNGTGFAKLLGKALKKRGDFEIILTTIKLNPASPLESPIEFGLSKKEAKSKVIILIDDVANTGRTLFFAMKPLMDILAKRIEVAVLVDRKHKAFPIKVDYVGLALATTIEENIDVQILKTKDKAVFLN